MFWVVFILNTAFVLEIPVPASFSANLVVCTFLLEPVKIEKVQTLVLYRTSSWNV